MAHSPFDRRFNAIDRTDFYWLAYLIFFLIEPIERHSLHFWLETVAILVVFLAMYVTFLLRGPYKRQLLLLAGMAVLGAAVLPSNGGAAAFTIYAAALVSFVVISPAWVFVILLGLAALLGAEAHWIHFNIWATFIDVFFTLVVGATNFHFAQKYRADCKLRMQQEEIEALAAVAERERIARDLHDVLGHTLSVIVLKSELANRLLQRELASFPSQLDPSPKPTSPLDTSQLTRSTQPASNLDLSNLAASPQPTSPLDTSQLTRSTQPASNLDLSNLAASASTKREPSLSTLQRAQAEIADVERTARTALAEVREAIGGYRARGLGAEIEAARNTLASAGVTLHTEGDLHPATLSAAEETVLALALREAVTNIVRHAQASTCRLRILHEHGRHRLSIEDNGKHAIAREGNGLRGMRERVESLGGHLSLSHETGTLLTIDLPQRATS